MVSISGIIGGAKTVYKYGRRIAGSAPELIFGTGAEAAGRAMRTARTSGSSLFQTAEAGWKAAESVGKGSFFKSFFANCKNFIPDVARYVKAGTKVAAKKGTSQIAGGLKGLTKGLGKKMPFIGSLSMLLFELPNIWTATKEQGLWQGLKETVKSGARLTGGAAGAAIGSAICPGFGSLAGWVIGEWLTSKVVGQSYTEEKVEKEEQRAQIIEELQNQGVILRETPENIVQVPPTAQPGYNTNPGITPNPVTNPTYTYPPQQFPPFGPMNPFSTTDGIPYANDIRLQNLPFNQVV